MLLLFFVFVALLNMYIDRMIAAALRAKFRNVVGSPMAAASPLLEKDENNACVRVSLLSLYQTKAIFAQID